MLLARLVSPEVLGTIAGMLAVLFLNEAANRIVQWKTAEATASGLRPSGRFLLIANVLSVSSTIFLGRYMAGLHSPLETLSLFLAAAAQSALLFHQGRLQGGGEHRKLAWSITLHQSFRAASVFAAATWSGRVEVALVGSALAVVPAIVVGRSVGRMQAAQPLAPAQRDTFPRVASLVLASALLAVPGNLEILVMLALFGPHAAGAYIPAATLAKIVTFTASSGAIAAFAFQPAGRRTAARPYVVGILLVGATMLTLLLVNLLAGGVLFASLFGEFYRLSAGLLPAAALFAAAMGAFTLILNLMHERGAYTGNILAVLLTSIACGVVSLLAADASALAYGLAGVATLGAFALALTALRIDPRTKGVVT